MPEATREPLDDAATEHVGDGEDVVHERAVLADAGRIPCREPIGPIAIVWSRRIFIIVRIAASGQWCGLAALEEVMIGSQGLDSTVRLPLGGGLSSHRLLAYGSRRSVDSSR